MFKAALCIVSLTFCKYRKRIRRVGSDNPTKSETHFAILPLFDLIISLVLGIFSIKDYQNIWDDLKMFSRQWRRVLLPTDSNIEMGASEAIRATLPREIIFHHTSPIIRIRAVKNSIERKGMKRANLKDAAAMCETLSYLEERVRSAIVRTYIALFNAFQFTIGDLWTEEMLAKETDRSRYEQENNRGLSYRTIVAFGPNAAKLHYNPKPNASAELTNQNLILIDSGGQYLEGTTAVSRTIHLGTPTQEQKKAYTNALLGLIRLSNLVIPHDINPSSLDSVIRGPVWTERQDYQHLTGSGIGSYLSVVECQRVELLWIQIANLFFHLQPQ